MNEAASRRTHLRALEITDFDSERMVVHIRGGKGRKDRDVMLSSARLSATPPRSAML